MFPKTTLDLLVSDATLLEVFALHARQALERGVIVRTFPENASGQEGASLVRVELSPEDAETIRLADQFASSHGATPPIAVAEPQG